MAISGKTVVARPRVEAHAATAALQDTKSMTWLPAWRLREMIGRREISPVEVIDHFLGRIEELNPLLNAFRGIDYRGAREQARRAERAVLAREHLGSLHGVPVALKEDIPIKGLPTINIQFLDRFVFSQAVAPRDSIQAERLRAAGAILVGSTVALGPRGLAQGTPFDDVGAQRPRNPWDTNRVPGLSSAGSAVAVAGGLVPVAMGSDYSGSIRVPSAFCGLMGLVTTRGRIPSHQLQLEEKLWGTCTGPMTRDVRDAAIVLQSVAGPDGRDLLSLQDDPPKYVENVDRGVAGMRVTWTNDFGFAGNYALPQTARVIEMLRSAALGLGRMGVVVDQSSEVWEEPIEENGDRRIAGIGFRTSGEIRARNWQRCRSLFARYDMILSPTVQFIAPTFDEWDRGARFAESGSAYHGLAAEADTGLMSLGMPAATVPAGFLQNMPLGIQIIGHANDEVGVLRLAYALLKVQA